MTIVRKVAVLAMHIVDGPITCTDCMTAEDWEGITEDAIISENDITEDHLIFCDTCKQMIAH
jgi:hypothetical protein